MLQETTKYLTWLTFPAKEDLAPSWRKVYMQCADRVFLPTHVRQPFTSYVIDLGLTEEELLANYTKKLRENIRRAIREGVAVEWDHDPGAVVALFQSTIQVKQLNPLQASDFEDKENVLFARATHPEFGVLAAHAYQIDLTTSKVKLLYNASAFRQYPEDKATQYLCGRANSLLFHQAFLHCKQFGLNIFDFGGFGLNTPQVDYFKQRFGGTVVRQYNYFPIWHYLVRMIRNARKKHGHGR